MKPLVSLDTYSRFSEIFRTITIKITQDYDAATSAGQFSVLV